MSEEDKDVYWFLNNVSEIIPILEKNLKEDYQVRPGHVYHEASFENIKLIGQLIDNVIYEESAIKNPENLMELYRRCNNGESCLILMEHYGNFDFPALMRLTEREPTLGHDVMKSILPIQGIKLTAGNPATPAFSNSYSTISIFPSRYLDGITDPEEFNKTKMISNPINHTAMKEITKRKYEGRMILVFPSGTRYRAWEPDTKKGVREIDSYIKVFENLVFVSINGNSLLPNKDGDMGHDILRKDIMLYTVSPVISCKKFRESVSDEPGGSDIKRCVADAVMEQLEKMHKENEVVYRELLKESGKTPTVIRDVLHNLDAFKQSS